MKLTSEKAVLAVEQVKKRETGEVLFTQLKLTDRAGTIVINDGGWALDQVPEMIPCRVELEVVPQARGFTYTLRLAKDHPPVIEVLR